MQDTAAFRGNDPVDEFVFIIYFSSHKKIPDFPSHIKETLVRTIRPLHG